MADRSDRAAQIACLFDRPPHRAHGNGVAETVIGIDRERRRRFADVACDGARIDDALTNTVDVKAFEPRDTV